MGTGPLETVSTRAVLTFGAGPGMKQSFSIPRARVDKTTLEAQASMQAILDSGALDLSHIGVPTDIKGAKIVHTTRRQIA